MENRPTAGALSPEVLSTPMIWRLSWNIVAWMTMSPVSSATPPLITPCRVIVRCPELIATSWPKASTSPPITLPFTPIVSEPRYQVPDPLSWVCPCMPTNCQVPARSLGV